MPMELLDLPYEPTSASVARRTVVHVLRSRGVPSERCEDAALVVSELVGNALRHGRPRPRNRLTVQWELTGERLHVQVIDGGGPGEPVRRSAQPGVVATSGRGLEIVAIVADGWGTRCDEAGTTVWAEIGLDGVGSTAVADADGLDQEEYERAG